jgi:hypothetical protein
VSDVRATFRDVLLASAALAIAFAPAIVLNKLNSTNAGDKRVKHGQPIRSTGDRHGASDAQRAGSAQVEVSGSPNSEGY